MTTASHQLPFINQGVLASEREDSLYVAKLVQVPKDKRSLSPPKQDFLLDCVLYSNNKKEINFINDKIQRLTTPSTKENTPNTAQMISTGESRKFESRISTGNKKLLEMSHRADVVNLESDEIIIDDFFKQMKNKEKSFRQEIAGLLNKEATFKEKYPILSYNKIFEAHNKRLLPGINKKFDYPVRITPSTEFKLRQAAVREHQLLQQAIINQTGPIRYPSRVGNLDLSEILKFSPFPDSNLVNLPEVNKVQNIRASEQTETSSGNPARDSKAFPNMNIPSGNEEGRYKFVDVYLKSLRKQSQPAVGSKVTNPAQRNVITPIRPRESRPGRHESMDSGVNKTFSHDPRPRLQSSPSPITAIDNLVTPTEESHRTNEKGNLNANGIPKRLPVRDPKPRFMSEKRTRNEQVQEKVQEKQRKASADPKIAPKLKKMLVNNAPESINEEVVTPSSDKTAKFPTNGMNSPAIKSQGGGNSKEAIALGKKQDIVPIKESRESSEVSINSFNPTRVDRSQENNRMNFSKESAEIKEELTALKEDPLEEENTSIVQNNNNRKPTISKRSLNKRSPNSSKPSGTLNSQNQNSMHATDSYEKTLTSGYTSNARGESVGRKSSRYMNIQDNIETFEPNVDVKVPQNKDVFYECTSLTRISQFQDDNMTSLSKDNSRAASKYSGVGNEIMINVSSNHQEHKETASSQISHNNMAVKQLTSDSGIYASSNGSNIVSHPSNEFISVQKSKQKMSWSQHKAVQKNSSKLNTKKEVVIQAVKGPKSGTTGNQLNNKPKSIENDTNELANEALKTDSSYDRDNHPTEHEDSYEDQFEVISRGTDTDINPNELESEERMNRNDDVRQTFNPQTYINERISGDDRGKKK